MAGYRHSNPDAGARRRGDAVIGERASNSAEPVRARRRARHAAHASERLPGSSSGVSRVEMTPGYGIADSSGRAAVSGKKRPLTRIDNVAPSADARNAYRDHRRPEVVGKGSLAKEGMRRRNRRKLLIVVLCILLALAVAVAVGMRTYFKATDRNLGLGDSDAPSALVVAEPNEPYYVLCTAYLSEPAELVPNTDDLAVMLVRVDESHRALTFASIPASLQVNLSDTGTYRIADIPTNLGDAALISAISDFAGVDIAHYVTTDASRLSCAVDEMGGIELDVASEVDDPHAGSRVIDAGLQSLDSEGALTLLRATNVSGGFAATSASRVDFTLALLSEALDKSGLGLASYVSSASSYIQTDWTASELISLGESMQSLSDVTVYRCSVPCSETTSVSNGSKTLSCSAAKWEIMREAMVNGDDPSGANAIADSDALRDCSVEIRNGASINGAAADLSAKLEALGYEVGAVGNANDGVIYPDTLVVYTNPESEGHATMVLGDLSCGRLVNGGDFYSTDSDVLVIIGSDWVY